LLPGLAASGFRPGALLALVAKVPVYGDRAHRALGILASWDCNVAAESRGAALYEVFRLELLRGLLQPLLGGAWQAVLSYCCCIG